MRRGTQRKVKWWLARILFKLPEICEFDLFEVNHHVGWDTICWYEKWFIEEDYIVYHQAPNRKVWLVSLEVFVVKYNSIWIFSHWDTQTKCEDFKEKEEVFWPQFDTNADYFSENAFW